MKRIAALFATVIVAPPAAAQCDPPGQVQNVRITGDCMEIEICWDPVPLAETYDVFVAGQEYLGMTGPCIRHTFPPTSGACATVVAVNSCGRGPASEPGCITLGPPALPADPQPADGACIASLGPELMWVGATYLCELWFWSDEDLRFPAPGYVGIVSCGSASPPTELLPGKTYFWKVLVYNDCEGTMGPTWSFTTEPCSTCYPDCDESGELDFFDFICFQNAFAAGDPYADCDESGAHDFFDFICFQNAFAAGCP